MNSKKIRSIFKNASVLFVATAIANVILLIGYTLLIRVYPTSIMGEYFSLISISTIFSSILYFGLVHAIPLMKDAEVKYAVTLMILLSMTLLLIGVISFLISTYYALIMMVSGILGTVILVETVLIREGKLIIIAILRVIYPLLSFTAMLLVGVFIGTEYDSLVISYVAGMSLTMVASIYIIVWPHLCKVSGKNIFTIIITYKNFLKYIGPGQLFHSAAYNIPSAAGLGFFGGEAIAVYNIAYKFVMAPMSILGQAIGQGYISMMSSEHRSLGNVSFSYLLDVVLFCIASIVCVIIYFVFPIVAAVLFPENHEEISKFGTALIPLVFSMISVSPISNYLQFTNNQKRIFFAHFTSFLISCFSFGVGVWKEDLYIGIFSFSILMTLRYAWLYLEIIQVRKGGHESV